MDDKFFKKSLLKQIEILLPLHSPLDPPKEGEWLYEHEEEGQTFKEYLNSNPVLPRGKHKIIYIQLLGDLLESERKIINATSEFIGVFYNLPIKEKESLSKIPSHAQRNHPTWGDFQILTSYVLKKILRPTIPNDAAAFIALTANDLWPGKGWNFVFGQASLKHRVGVWSIYRNGDPEKDYNLCLKRTMKTGTHELGHIFSLKHCIQYNCAMNGSNSRVEADSRPLICCPECMAKICWATQTDPIKRFENLSNFCLKYGFTEDKKIYQKHISYLTDSKN